MSDSDDGDFSRDDEDFSRDDEDFSRDDEDSSRDDEDYPRDRDASDELNLQEMLACFQSGSLGRIQAHGSRLLGSLMRIDSRTLAVRLNETGFFDSLLPLLRHDGLDLLRVDLLRFLKLLTEDSEGVSVLLLYDADIWVYELVEDETLSGIPVVLGLALRVLANMTFFSHELVDDLHARDTFFPRIVALTESLFVNYAIADYYDTLEALADLVSDITKTDSLPPYSTTGKLMPQLLYALWNWPPAQFAGPLEHIVEAIANIAGPEKGGVDWDDLLTGDHLGQMLRLACDDVATGPCLATLVDISAIPDLARRAFPDSMFAGLARLITTPALRNDTAAQMLYFWLLSNLAAECEEFRRVIVDAGLFGDLLRPLTAQLRRATFAVAHALVAASQAAHNLLSKSSYEPLGMYLLGAGVIEAGVAFALWKHACSSRENAAAAERFLNAITLLIKRGSTEFDADYASGAAAEPSNPYIAALIACGGMDNLPRAVLKHDERLTYLVIVSIRDLIVLVTYLTTNLTR